MVDYNCMELMFLLGIHHVVRIRRIRCLMGFPPPMDFLPPDKIPYGKSCPSMGFLSPPPPSQHKSHMLSQYYIWTLCWRRFAIEGEVLPWDFFRGEGLPYGIISLGKFCYGISSRGKVFHMVFLQGNVCHMV